MNGAMKHEDGTARHHRYFPEPCIPSSMGGRFAYRGETRMTQQTPTQPLSKDQVLTEVAFLITVEHALIVEYLSVSCALGYDLAGADGGPADGPGRAAAAAAKNQADFLMLRVAALVRALSALRPTGGFDRAIEIADASGTKIS